MNFWKEKKNTGAGTNFQKKRSNWNQSLRSIKSNSLNKSKKIKKSLQFLLVLRKFRYNIDYKNVKLLKAFLTKFGKIRPRRKTRIFVQEQHKISKAIRKARDLKLIPFTVSVKV